MELAKLVSEVGEWAEINFGDNSSKFVNQTFQFADNTIVAPLILGSLAPLMGIFEELSEFATWIDMPHGPRNSEDEQKREDEIFDSLGDMAIYTADYMKRESVTVDRRFAWQRIRQYAITHPYDPTTDLVKKLGKLYHCTLKAHQGIRGMDQIENYMKARDTALLAFLASLDAASVFGIGEPISKVAESVWRRVVSKRNWKTNKHDGTNS